ncbi:MAG: polymorphic toxin type 28 domain-containing protein [Proteobacteria bacterium]|nr:polymorphic toxin type 28 domain-containing protein [Pseudomonadota bacterium]
MGLHRKTKHHTAEILGSQSADSGPRVAPGKRTRTAAVTSSRAGGVAPGQRRDTTTPVRRDDQQLEQDWTRVAFLPHEYATPEIRPLVQRTPKPGSGAENVASGLLHGPSRDIQAAGPARRVLHVAGGETLKLSAGSSKSPVIIRVLSQDGSEVAHTEGNRAELAFTAPASGYYAVVVEPVDSTRLAGTGTIARTPSGTRLMVAREGGSTIQGYVGENEDGASVLSARQHLLLNMFAINPGSLSPATGLGMAQSLDKLELMARLAASNQGDQLPGTIGDMELRTEYRRSGQSEIALYELADGTSQLTLRTNRDTGSGTLVATLDFRTGDGTAVHGTLTYLPNVSDGMPASLASDLVGDYLSSPPGCFGTIDDFSDIAGDPASRGSEGVGSFLQGALLGEFSDNQSWSATGGQTAMGFVPIAGQIADLRDIAAASGDVWKGKQGAWSGLGMAVVAVIPGLDFLKGSSAAGRKALAQAAEGGMDATARAGLKRTGKVISKEAAARASKELTTLAVARKELLVRWQLVLADQSLSIGARANLQKARNAVEDHLKPDDLAGALRDKLGIPVRKSGRGDAWDHAGEVDNVINSLSKARDALHRDLRRMPPDTESYQALSQAMDEMAELSRRVSSFLEIR